MAVSVHGLAKAFGSTQALIDCSVEIHSGEVHVLLGENGSGKSTLTKIITGVHQADRGTIQLADGVPVTFHSPAEAQTKGVVAVYQDILTAPALSVLDNVWLGTDRLLRTQRSAQAKLEEAQEVITRLLGRSVDMGMPVASLSLSDQQACCIARALVRDFSVLVLDEATSALDLEVRNRLFETVRELRDSGKSVLFVSHRMDEIREIGDRLTVIRSGRTVAVLESANASDSTLLSLLTGEDELELDREVHGGQRGREITMRVTAIGAPVDAKRERIEIRDGEILALAGLEGHGQEAFLHALWGLRPDVAKAFAVQDGLEREVSSPRAAAKMGIAYVPRDRRADASFGDLSVLENFGLPTLGLDTKLGVIRRRRTRSRFESFAKTLRLRYRHADDPMTTLSGGNQQKIILARWLALGPRVLLLNDPTRGVDMRTKRDIYALLRQLRAEGVTVVFLSSEIDEIVMVADRVIVFRQGGVASDLRGSELTREGILTAYFGLLEPR